MAGLRSVIVTEDYDEDAPEINFEPPAHTSSDPDSTFSPKEKVERPRDAYLLLLKKALENGLAAATANDGVSFTIGTMCSGTDSPILALREFQEAALALGHSNLFEFDHTFSVEIEAFKQAFIERNAKPSGEVFRDVVDVSMRTEEYAWVPLDFLSWQERGN